GLAPEAGWGDHSVSLRPGAWRILPAITQREGLLSTSRSDERKGTRSALGERVARPSVRRGEGFRTPAIQAVVWHEAGVRKPPMHDPAGRGRCYGDLKNLVLLQSSQRAVNGCQQQANQAAMS